MRVYAEATTQVSKNADSGVLAIYVYMQESADLLAEQVGVKVHKIAGGVGEPPKL